MNIIEDYVSFECAKLLKKKEFNSKCIAYYLEFNGNIKFYECNDLVQGLPYISNDNWGIILRNPLESGYTAPTLQMAMKWLREVHNLHIIVFYYDNSAFPYIWYIFAHNRNKPHKANSYEEACEAAIKYCLENLI